MPKPSVLPVPVFAWPMMSWPAIATGRVMAWMGNGAMMPASANASTISGRTPKSLKVASATWMLLEVLVTLPHVCLGGATRRCEALA
jgi:hypothetical protein